MELSTNAGAAGSSVVVRIRDAILVFNVNLTIARGKLPNCLFAFLNMPWFEEQSNSSGSSLYKYSISYGILKRSFAPRILAVMFSLFYFTFEFRSHTKRFVERLAILYGCASPIIGIIVPSNDDELLGAQTPAQVLYARSLKAGIRGLNHATDAAILTSAWSAGNAFFYSGSRALYSMSLGGQPQSYSAIPINVLSRKSLYFSHGYLLSLPTSKSPNQGQSYSIGL